MIFPSSELRDRRAIRLADYWNERRRETGFPARRDFDPLDVVFALGNIVLVEVTYEPVRFRFKLVGSNIGRHLGFDSTGQYIDEQTVPEYRQLLLTSYTEALQLRTPVAVGGERSIDGQPLRYECVLLPLSDDGQTINMFLTGVFLHQGDGVPEDRGLSAFAPMPESLRAQP